MSRWAFGLSLNWDEAEAFFFARHLAWGYGPQPPLYFWLQWGVFQVLGENVLALAVFKNALLFGTVVLLYRFLRREAGSAEAGVAALSLGLIASLVWEAQRALTHTALAMLVAVAATWIAVRALESGRWRDYLLLGLAVGIGTLSKLNFLVWAAALLGAALILPEWRRRIRPGPTCAAVLVALLINVPVLLWMLRNPELSTVGIRKLEFATESGLQARLVGTGALAFATLNFFILPLLVLGGFWLAARRRPGSALPPGVRLYGLASGLSLLLLWVGILATRSTEVDHIWLMPMASGLVPVAVLALWPRLTERARRGLAGTEAALWLLALVLLPASAFLGPSSSNRWLDFGPVAARLAQLQGEGLSLVLNNVHVAGNLVLREHGLDLTLLTVGTPDVPAERLALVTRLNDPLLERPDVQARMEAHEEFPLLDEPGARRQAVTLLSAQ
nr:glycosyltransferase family 39 protein [Rubellimicrobium arenae]